MTETSDNGRPEAEAVAEIVKKHIAPTVVPLTVPDEGSAAVLVLPDGLGLRAHDIKPYLDAYRKNPEFRKGTARLQDLASLVAYVNRFKNEDSALFADRNMAAPAITGIIDYHDAVNSLDGVVDTEAKARFAYHRANYAFPLSDEWKAWKTADGTLMDQQAFAEFLEDRIGDVMMPPDLNHAPLDDDKEAKLANLVGLLGGAFASPSRLMELSRGLAVRVSETVKQATTLSSGEMQIQYTAAHQDEQGQPLKVPTLFLVAIPVFRSGALYQIAIRLRYRVSGGSVKWCCQMYRPDKVFEHAFDEACVVARDGTALPLFMGCPES
jgi:hypothetical protein